MEKKTVTVRLWGTLAYCTEAQERKERVRAAKLFGVKPEQVVIERMTLDNKNAKDIVDKQSQRGGVESGTGRDSEEDEDS